MAKPTNKPGGGNNQPPTILDQSFSLAENSANDTFVDWVEATDPEGLALVYSIQSGNDDGAFEIDSETGGISVADGSLLDYETTPERQLVVAVSDGSKTSTATITIALEDANDAPTDISLSSLTFAPAHDGAVVGSVLVHDQDDPAGLWGQHSFTLSDNRFEIVDGSLKLKADESIDEGESVDLVITATDGDGASVVKEFTLTAATSPTLPATVNLGELDTVGFTISGSTDSATGWDVEIAGDVNGDGFDDFVVTRLNLGDAFVIYGAEGLGDLSLDDITPGQGFRVFATGGHIDSVSSGDINGDGFGDLVFTGAVNYVLYGSENGFAAEVDLAALPDEQASVITGVSSPAVAFADINNDGFDDLILGDPGGDGAGRKGGQAGDVYVIFGSEEGFGDVDVSNMEPSDGIRIRGAAKQDQVGISVSSAGDINGDGIEDIFIGALGVRGSGKSSPNPGEGAAYVIFGKDGGLADIDLGALSATDGFRILSGDSGDWMGRAVSSAGDVNGDGIDDLLVSADRAGGEGNLKHWAGEAYVIFGKELAPGEAFGDIDVDQMSPDEGIRIIGADAEDRTGTSVAAVGDVNGDGHADFLVSARRGDGSDGTDSGEIYLIFGKPDLGTIDLGEFTAEDGVVFYGADMGDMAGYSISGGGDVNGDGKNDILIGTGSGDEAYLIFGW